MKGAKHTPGWVRPMFDANAEDYPCPILGQGAETIAKLKNGADRDRAIECVNGCDAAGVADPEELDVLLAAARAVNENRTMIPHNPDCVGLRGKADCDSLGCRGGSGYVPKAILISLGDALRRVRGES